MVAAWWDAYWRWAGSNIGAMPAEALITVAATFIFQRPIRRFVTWLRRDAHSAIGMAREDARAAREIAADLYRHVTGEDHPAQAGE